MIISQKIDSVLGFLSYFVYTRIYCPIKAFLMRRKSQINVIFIITELGVWKTENLYLKMKQHPKFNPVIRVLPSTENICAKGEVVAYLNAKGYEYECIDADESLQKRFKADIIFYQKPYLWVYSSQHTFLKNKRSLFCYVTYSFHDVVSDYICNQPFFKYIWQYYFENQKCADETASVMDNKGYNINITGIPMSDAFLLPSELYHAHWKPQLRLKKKIIWAPHFSVSDGDVLAYSTFLKYHQFMVEQAVKYKSQVQLLFKPHPLLFPRLCQLWGQSKVEEYYALWANMDNTQVGFGQYIDYFMTSDAMIHDCGSFTIEYMYTQKPVMYLLKSDSDIHDSNLNSLAKNSFHLHYMGKSEQDIESFIQDVIEGRDILADERTHFFKTNLLPPNGKTACDNIIDAILGN